MDRIRKIIYEAERLIRELEEQDKDEIDVEMDIEKLVARSSEISSIDLINKLLESNPIRPPKRWWDKVFKKVKEFYGYPDERVARIVGGIWYGFDEATQRRIARKYG